VSDTKVIPLCTIEADWPVEIRPIAGGLNQALALKRTLMDSGQALYALCRFATSGTPKCFRCELHDPDPDRRVPGWNKTWLISDSQGPLAFTNKELRFVCPNLT